MKTQKTQKELKATCAVVVVGLTICLGLLFTWQNTIVERLGKVYEKHLIK
ncbi:MAG: hypothetical protein HRT74_03650 [Flavobacteriales bacterium]|nr:hypothetical protein [Flavobacteriales bacterium]